MDKPPGVDGVIDNETICRSGRTPSCTRSVMGNSSSYILLTALLICQSSVPILIRWSHREGQSSSTETGKSGYDPALLTLFTELCKCLVCTGLACLGPKDLNKGVGCPYEAFSLHDRIMQRLSRILAAFQEFR
jgi:hypothetical protein